MTAALLPVVSAVAVLALGCGGSSADDVARETQNAIKATKSGIAEVPDSRAESAAAKTVCDALSAYSAVPVEPISRHLRKEAQRQRFLARFGLNDVDPDAVDRLADALEPIDDSQDAAEVGDKLGCSI